MLSTNPPKVTNFDRFFLSYIGAALWSSNDESDEPLDKNYDRDDLADDCRAAMEADCRAFWEAHGEAIEALEEAVGPATTYITDVDLAADRVNAEYAGHDFWLTRCRHGAGFWDGHWPEPLATVLIAASHAAGERWLEVGDDGKIHQM